LGWTDIEVVRVPADWTDAQVKAFAIADNRTAELANWNQEVLTSQLLELEADGWELTEFGFEPLEMPVNPDDIVEDEIPDSAPVRTALGDVWQLGNHRLMCGDSTNSSTISLLMDNAKADIVITDPPYGLDRNLARSPNREWRLKNDDPANAGAMYQAVRQFDYVSERYVWGQWNTWNFLIESLGMPDNCIVWDKQHFGMGHGYRHQHEFCAYYGEKSFPSQADVWYAKRDYSGLHPTMKPIELLVRCLENSSEKNQIVVDIFGGSGSTLIAAEQASRICYMMELDPKYCDVIIERWEKLTGQKAELLPAKAD
jgi:site-specific DNA-methyltransferase (adenine-specific)